MTHYFEKTIVDAKDIYTGYLINVLNPLLYEGFFSIYEKAKSLETTYIQASKIDPNVKNPGVLVLFQHFLIVVDKLNDNLVDEETKRIRDNSKCADIFDNLIKAVLKSHIIVLTYTASGKKCKIVNEKIHEKIESRYFIHKCYVECARLFYDHPMLFWHEFCNSELKDNQRIIYQLIKVGVKNAIKRCLPMKEILEVYLNNDYIEESENSENEYVKVKDMLEREVHKKNDEDNGGVMKIIDTTDSVISEDIENLETNVNNLSSLIFNRNIYDTLEGKSEEHLPIQDNDVEEVIQMTRKSPEMTRKSPEITTKMLKSEDKVKSEQKNPEITTKMLKSEDKIKSEHKRSEKSEHKRSEKSEAKHVDKSDAKTLDDSILFKQKGKNVKSSILIDAIKAINKDVTDGRINDDDHNKINVIRHSHNLNDNDNYFDELGVGVQ